MRILLRTVSQTSKMYEMQDKECITNNNMREETNRIKIYFGLKKKKKIECRRKMFLCVSNSLYACVHQFNL